MEPECGFLNSFLLYENQFLFGEKTFECRLASYKNTYQNIFVEGYFNNTAIITGFWFIEKKSTLKYMKYVYIEGFMVYLVSLGVHLLVGGVFLFFL